MIHEVTKDNPVVLGETPVLLDFYATWCGPCKMTSKNLEEFEKEHPDFTIYKINVDENEDIAEQYRVQSLPTLIYISESGIIWEHNGLLTTKLLKEKLGL